MLQHLHIKNFTLISELDIAFSSGFSVITGETGAGKSIILGALNLLTGQRADMQSIKQGCNRCVIEASFDISRYHLDAFFADNDIDYDPAECILRRELNASGKSRAFVNDTPVALATIRQLGERLIDIHSQHQNLLIAADDFQLGVVDIMAQNAQLLANYKAAYNAYRQAAAAVTAMERTIAEGRRNEDYLRFQLQELQLADLRPGLQEELERESETLGNIEDIKAALYAADALLSGAGESSGQPAVTDSVRLASRHLSGISNVYAEIDPLSQRLDSALIELKDIADDIAIRLDSLDYDPQRLEIITAQLDKIYTLEKKHQLSSVEQLIDLRNDIEQQLGHMDNSDQALQDLRAAEQQALAAATAAAQQLTAARQAAAKTVESEMRARLVPLGIPNVRFEVLMEQKALAADGADQATFLFSANNGTPLQPIAAVASGGEIARVMLSLKAMTSSAVQLPTIIFDEIDTGVSGKVAQQMALMMREMGQADRQVISITHLPQIAAMGAAHYRVEKHDDADNGTISTMRRLNPDERTTEIAKMLSGADITAAAIDNAKALLNTNS